MDLRPPVRRRVHVLALVLAVGGLLVTAGAAALSVVSYAAARGGAGAGPDGAFADASRALLLLGAASAYFSAPSLVLSMIAETRPPRLLFGATVGVCLAVALLGIAFAASVASAKPALLPQVVLMVAGAVIGLLSALRLVRRVPARAAADLRK